MCLACDSRCGGLSRFWRGRIGLDGERGMPCGVFILLPERTMVLSQLEVLGDKLGALPMGHVDALASPKRYHVALV